MSADYYAVLIVLEAVICSFAFCYPVRWILLQWNVIDRPNERSSHTTPTARGGGIAILLTLCLIGYLNVYVNRAIALTCISGLMLGIVSFLDDLRPLPQVARLVVQAGAAAGALYALCHNLSWNLPPLESAGIVLLGFFWILGYTNSFNFMDGINGIACMQVATTGVGTAIVGVLAGGSLKHPAVTLSLILAGGGIGFLPHNFPKARMFLGDVGSASIGFFLAVISFWLSRDLGWWLLGAFGLLHANFIIDTSFTLIRRIRNREKWFNPHREHFYQRLLRAGMSHESITIIEALVQIGVIGLVVSGIRSSWLVRSLMAVTICVVWVMFFAYAELRFRRRVLT